MLRFLFQILLLSLFVTGFPNGPAHADTSLKELRLARQEALATRKENELRELSRELARNLARLEYALDPARDADFSPDNRDGARAARLACAANDQDACRDLARFYRWGSGVFMDEPLAISIYWLGCRDKHLPSCDAFLSISSKFIGFHGSSPAIPVLSDRCAQADGKACRLLAQHYAQENPWGVTPDEELRQTLNQMACDFGDEQVCPNAAELLTEQRRLSRIQDLEDCENGQAKACGRVALTAQSKNLPERRFKYTMRACDLGSEYYCNEASKLISWGRGTQKNPSLAREILARICNEDPAKCAPLASLYENGRLVAADKARAIELYKQSCAAEGTAPNDCADVRRLTFDVFAQDTDALVPSGLRQRFAELREGCAAERADDCARLGQVSSGMTSSQLLSAAGRDLVKLGCQLGDPRACFNRHAYFGSDLERLEYFQKACDAGIGEACVLPILQDTERENREVISELVTRCDEGLGAACATLGNLHADWGNTGQLSLRQDERDPARAWAYHQRACDLPEGHGCDWLGEVTNPARKDTKVTSNYPKGQDMSLAYLENGCRAGNGAACFGLAWDLRSYRQFDKSFDAAVTACELTGDCRLVFEAQIYLDQAGQVAKLGPLGAAMEPNNGKFTPHWHGAVQRMSRSCRSANLVACIELGDALGDRNNAYSTTDEMLFRDQAYYLYEHVCDQGEALGCSRLAEITYVLASVGPEWINLDFENAKTAAIAACEQSLGEACGALAGQFEYGEIYPTNKKKAHELYDKGCQLGHLPSCRGLSELDHLSRQDRLNERLRSCIRGNSGTCISLARYHFENDREIRTEVLRYGCADGAPEACQMLRQ